MNWKRKIGSRKFWALVSGVATSFLVITGASEETAVQITGLITSVGAVVVYILAEAHVDASAAKGKKEGKQDG